MTVVAAAAGAEVVSVTNMAAVVEDEAEEAWATESPEKATGPVMGKRAKETHTDETCCIDPVCLVAAPTIFPEEMNASNATHQDLVEPATVAVEAAAAEATEAVEAVAIVVVVIVQTADETAMMTAQTADVITTADEVVAVMTTAKTTDTRDVIVPTSRPMAILSTEINPSFTCISLPIDCSVAILSAFDILRR